MGCGGSKADNVEKPMEEKEEEVTAETSVALAEKSMAPIAVTNGPLSSADLAKRLIGSEKAEEFGLGKEFILRYGVLSQRGYYPEDLLKVNQDKYIVQTDVGAKMDMILGVFDGRGPEGDMCAGFVRKHMVNELKAQATTGTYANDFSKAYTETFRMINRYLHEEDDIDDSYSGTTAVCATFFGSDMYVANIGNSRAVIAERRGKNIVASQLSFDQTPHRRDERERVKAAGAMIMTTAMAEGKEKYDSGWVDTMKEDAPIKDQPLVFESGDTRPGCNYTRSIGDRASKRLGVIAEAEMLKKHLKESDQAIMIATDGVWQYLSNQVVCDTVFQYSDPVDAARAIIGQAYSLWMQFQDSCDDITLIVAYIDHKTAGKAPRAASEQEVKEYEMAEKIKQSSKDEAEGNAPKGPIMHALTAESKKKLAVVLADSGDDKDDDGDFVMEVHKKTKAEVERISASMQQNFMFQNMPEEQLKKIYDCMKKTPFEADQVGIKQGDKGDSFYVLDDGELKVTILIGGLNVEILQYKPNPTGANPCFGELALMYAKPRGATVTAQTDGFMWELDRRSFREVLKKSSKGSLMRTLRGVDLFKPLSVNQLQKLAEKMKEERYEPNQFVIKQGEEGNTFYIISEGKAVITKNDPEFPERGKELATIYDGMYFGERAILNSETRAANVLAGGNPNARKKEYLKLLSITKDNFEEVLGPLSKIMEDFRDQKYKQAAVKQLKKMSVNLTNAKLSHFEIKGLMCKAPPTKYVLATHMGKIDKDGNQLKAGVVYTIRARSKKQVVDMHMQTLLKQEMKLLTTMVNNEQYLPLPLQTMEDDAYIYSVLPTKVVCTLSDLMEHSGLLEEPSCRYFAAAISEGLQVVHAECATLGGVIYRNLDPSTVTLNENGCPQLLDTRFAVTAEPPPRDFCGQVHYLSPEQVSGNGHGKGADFWALGMLLYELMTASNPWVTGDPKKDSELSVYGKVQSHKFGELQFPAEAKVSVEMGKFLNELLHPEVDKRLGCKKGKLANSSRDQLRKHKWFEGFAWEELASGALASPAKQFCQERLKDTIITHQREGLFIFDDVYIPEEKDKNAFQECNETCELGFKTKRAIIANSENSRAHEKMRKEREEKVAVSKVKEEKIMAEKALEAEEAKKMGAEKAAQMAAEKNKVFEQKLDAFSEVKKRELDPEEERRKALLFGSLSSNLHLATDTVDMVLGEEGKAAGSMSQAPAGAPAPASESLLGQLSNRASKAARRASAAAGALIQSLTGVAEQQTPTGGTSLFGGPQSGFKLTPVPGAPSFGGYTPPAALKYRKTTTATSPLKTGSAGTPPVAEAQVMTPASSVPAPKFGGDTPPVTPSPVTPTPAKPSQPPPTWPKAADSFNAVF